MNTAGALSARFHNACPVTPTLFDRVRLDFPTPLEGTVSEINLLLREPMAHVGLADLDVFVEMFDGDEKVRGLADEDITRPPFAPAVWFVEITEGLAIFAAEQDACCDASRLARGLALGVTSAFADVHGIAASTEHDLRTGAMTLGFAALMSGRAHKV